MFLYLVRRYENTLTGSDGTCFGDLDLENLDILTYSTTKGDSGSILWFSMCRKVEGEKGEGCIERGTEKEHRKM
jgi:hypothetical protein